MNLERVLQRERVIKDLVTRKCGYSDAARVLGVTTRTVHNYYVRFVRHGPDGLTDRRKGNHRKLTPKDEGAIVACKTERQNRSARLIRDRLGLKVSEETVRLVLVKHHLNHRALEARPHFRPINSENLNLA